MRVVDLKKAGFSPQVPKGARVGVLEGAGITDTIAQDLSALGLSAEPLKSAGPMAIDRLRATLREFADRGQGPIFLHPGAGFWSERSELVTLASELGIQVLGPSPRVLSLFSNRVKLLSHAETVGVAHLAISLDPVQSVREVEERVGRFPLVLKSVRGGSGHGYCVIEGPEQLQRKLPLWIDQLRLNYGEALFYPERHLPGARYVVAPFARFLDGQVILFPRVDGSLQSRYRKIVEYCPADGLSGQYLDSEAVRTIEEWTRRLAESSQFVGVGALEFFVDDRRVFLLEGLARLNTGYKLWEKAAGTSAVAWQLAAHGLISRESVSVKAPQCEAMRMRIYAENPLLQLPQPGLVLELSEQREWKFPGAEARFLPVVEAQKELPAQEMDQCAGDGLIGFLDVEGKDRDLATSLSRGVLDEIWISGTLQTNQKYLRDLLGHPWVKRGHFHTGFTEEEFVPEVRPPMEVARTAAKLCETLSRALAVTTAGLVNHYSVAGFKITCDEPLPEKNLELKWAEPLRLELSQKALFAKVRLTDQSILRCACVEVGEGIFEVRVGIWSVRVRELRSTSTRVLTALVSGQVDARYFLPNSVIAPHENLLTLRSLGTLVPHSVGVPVKVREWKVDSGDRVVAGQVVAELEVVSSKSQA